MQELKANLLMIGRAMGDTGTPEQQGGYIDVFLEELQILMQAELIASFELHSIRCLYQYWANQMLASDNLDDARRAVCKHLWVQQAPRELSQPVEAPNVVSIFSSTRH